METQSKRKLQELGGSLYISVPSIWTNKFNLKKGNEVNIAIDKSWNMSLSPSTSHKEKEISQTILFDKYIFRRMIKEYLIGTDIIHINKETPFTQSEIKEIYNYSNRLLNVEIIEEKSDRITLQNLKSDIPLKKMISRMYFLTKSMFEDVINGYGDSNILHGVIERDQLVDKFYFAAIMQQRSALTARRDEEISFVEIMDLRLLIQKMEQIGDELKKLAYDKLSNNKTKIKIEDIKFLLNRYDCAYSSYFNKDVETAKTFWDSEKKDKERLRYNSTLLGIYDAIKDISDLVI